MIDCLLEAEIPALIQGASGRTGRQHLRLMQRYGTRIVGGVSATTELREIEGVPVFANCREAVAATGARASVLMVPALSVLAALTEAIEAGIELVVTVTEGVPVHDALKALRIAREHGATWVGASTPGIAIPGRLKLGFLPDVALAPGSLGVMSKSGTLSYEVGHRLVQRGLGQTLWVGVGGDLVKGTRFADLVPLFARHEPTRGIVVIGEIGGTEEEELAEALSANRMAKPVFALLAGSHAPEGVMMGHAGAMIYGNRGSFASKRAALEAAGARVYTTMDDLVRGIANDPNLLEQ